MIEQLDALIDAEVCPLLDAGIKTTRCIQTEWVGHYPTLHNVFRVRLYLQRALLVSNFLILFAGSNLIDSSPFGGGRCQRLALLIFRIVGTDASIDVLN